LNPPVVESERADGLATKATTITKTTKTFVTFVM